jgi:hypothetical protein
MSDENDHNPGDDIIAILREFASQNGTTLDAELRAMLDNRTRRLAPREARAIAEYIAGMAPKGVPQTDSVELLREDRNRG